MINSREEDSRRCATSRGERRNLRHERSLCLNSLSNSIRDMIRERGKVLDRNLQYKRY